MRLNDEALTDGNLDEVVAFFRQSNPFAQHTWGWDTGRFMDWRWGGNVLREAATPGWFSEHCRIFREGMEVRAVSVAESGRDDACIVTGGEDRDAVGHVLDWLLQRHADRGVGVSLEFADTADWLRTVVGGFGFVEEANTGHEWQYDLSNRSDRPQIPDGFTIEALTDDRGADYAGIATCIQQAFNSDHDVEPVLRSLESNPMFRPELSVFARSPDGRIAAYCRGTVDAVNGVCGIDPVCCHPDYQRMGLSKAVVQTCFRTQRRLGGRFSYIGSAPEPAPGTFLYRSLGPSGKVVSCRWSTPSDNPG